MLERNNKSDFEIAEFEGDEIHNKPADKMLVLVCAVLSGLALFLVAIFILNYKWWVGTLYFLGMFMWVILFFEYFNFSLFRKSPK